MKRRKHIKIYYMDIEGRICLYEFQISCFYKRKYKVRMKKKVQSYVRHMLEILTPRL